MDRLNFHFVPGGDWRSRLDQVVEMVLEMSQQHDPESLVRTYGARMRQFMPQRQMVSLSRRDLTAPLVRVTRFSAWTEAINPWKQPDKLPVLRGGLLADLIYSNRPQVVHDLRLSPDDPSRPYLDGCGSLLAIPHYDRGEALNMVVLGRDAADGFDEEQLPEAVLISNLFGRATQTLVLASQVREAYEAVDRELRAVAAMQRSLLPETLPRIDHLQLAAHYQTSRRAGGDYYDFFPLPQGRWGMLVADVSGHGTPAAVMMAVTHSIAHMAPASAASAQGMLAYLNRELAERYTNDLDTFVTAFYGVYDPARRDLTFACAGHNPPLWRRSAQGLETLDTPRQLPLGIAADERYEEKTLRLDADDSLVMYTDGITEAHDHHGHLFGVERLQQAVASAPAEAQGIIQQVLGDVEQFANGHGALDDQTLLVARVI